jgi:hypothetical protein
MLFESIKEMVGVGLRKGFDAKVIDTEAKFGGQRNMFPHAD